MEDIGEVSEDIKGRSRWSEGEGARVLVRVIPQNKHKKQNRNKHKKATKTNTEKKEKPRRSHNSVKATTEHNQSPPLTHKNLSAQTMPSRARVSDSHTNKTIEQ